MWNKINIKRDEPERTIDDSRIRGSANGKENRASKRKIRSCIEYFLLLAY